MLLTEQSDDNHSQSFVASLRCTSRLASRFWTVFARDGSSARSSAATTEFRSASSFRITVTSTKRYSLPRARMRWKNGARTGFKREAWKAAKADTSNHYFPMSTPTKVVGFVFVVLRFIKKGTTDHLLAREMNRPNI